MKEYGSDFHYIDFEKSINKIYFPDNSLFFGCGRYAINHLIKYYLNIGEWKNIFIPEYYCYKVVKSISETGIGIKFYGDYPLADDDNIISNIHFEKGDVLLRMNYFGLRDYRNNTNIPVPVIEDHSHSLFSNWAQNSNADWCVASLRKTLPIPDGGIIWSPKKVVDIGLPKQNSQHELLSKKRMEAMKLKSSFLKNKPKIRKEIFLQKFKQTENSFEVNNISSISTVSRSVILNLPNNLDVCKQRNFDLMTSMIDQTELSIVIGDSKEVPFSLILLFNLKEKRDEVRSYLINYKVYPVVLWGIDNEDAKYEISDFSGRMLSIPIDFRYSTKDIIEMSKIINSGIINSDNIC
jgi:hypothetical protein